jgi:DNA-3-methyladenine glycosylase I
MNDATAELRRCEWAGSDPLYLAYHDEEWGVSVHDDIKLFEMLTLEGAQAGLNWLTILRKREGYSLAFDGFEPRKIAMYHEQKIAALLNDERIVRNKLKVRSTIGNARAFLEVQEEFGTFDAYIWRFVGGAPKINCPASLSDLPAETDESRAMSKELRRRGFNFVGPTISYAFMQACGLVNDHTVECFRSPCR